MACAAMQQIADWLDKLGMSEYAERFAENGIDVSVLRYLTDQNLEKIHEAAGLPQGISKERLFRDCLDSLRNQCASVIVEFHWASPGGLGHATSRPVVVNSFAVS
jgi:hypothetical protein